MKLNPAKLIVAAILVAFMLSLAAADDKKPYDKRIKATSTKRIIVAPFSKPPSFEYSWMGIGNGLATMLITELSSRDALVLERQYEGALEREKEGALSGLRDAETTPALGKNLGADWQVIVTVTDIGFSSNKVGLGFITRNLGFGDVSVGSSKARVRLDARLVDIETGLILASASGEGANEQGSFYGAGGRWWDWAGGVSFESSEWLDSRLGRASRQAIEEIACRLIAEFPKAERKTVKNDRQELLEKLRESDRKPTVNLDALRGKSVIVVVPEQILTRPAPDPAAQTALIKSLIDHGITVKDDERIRELREDRAVAEMLRGRVDEAKLHDLRTRFGADILIVGEAFAERNNEQLEGSASAFYTGRCEIRAIWMEDGTILFADNIRAPGRDLSEASAGKDALYRAGEKLGPALAAGMAKTLGSMQPNAATGMVKISLEIGGWASLSEAKKFLQALDQIDGVERANFDEFRGCVMFATLEVDRIIHGEIGAIIETHQSLQSFGIALDTQTKTTIKGGVKK
ncbi:MAG TPA: CsgG/HfaB family protein [Fimbriimonadaceae bacterium]|nr:CsgG/HfaB family protein [Fimbriimonadaceae bacterium]